MEDNDVPIEGRGQNLELTRSYNSRANASGIFGANWTSNIEQKITDSGNEPILYQNGDGTYHMLTPPASVNGVYDHPGGVYLDLYKNSDNLSSLFHIKQEMPY